MLNFLRHQYTQGFANGSLSLSESDGCGADSLLRGTAETQQALRSALTALRGQSAELDVVSAITRAFALIGNVVCIQNTCHTFAHAHVRTDRVER